MYNNLARQLAAIAIDCLAPDLDGDKHCKAEDRLAEMFADKILSNIDREFWTAETQYQIECYDEMLDIPPDDLNDLVDSCVEDIFNDDNVWKGFADIVDWHINKYKSSKEDNSDEI